MWWSPGLHPLSPLLLWVPGTLAAASQVKSTLCSPYGGKNLVNWMHTALHTHCVLALGPAVLQTLAKWETFCAVKKKNMDKRSLDSDLQDATLAKKKKCKEKLRRLLHALQQRRSPARWACAGSLHFSPSYCVLKSIEGLSLMHIVSLGNLCWDPSNAALIFCFCWNVWNSFGNSDLLGRGQQWNHYLYPLIPRSSAHCPEMRHNCPPSHQHPFHFTSISGSQIWSCSGCKRPSIWDTRGARWVV